MNSRHQKIVRMSSYLLVSFLVLIILSVASINFLVPFYTGKALKSVSDSKKVELHAKRSGFGFFKGLKIEGLKLTGNGKETLHIKGISILPDYISSIREKKLVIKTVTLQKPVLNISNNFSDNILKLLSNEKDEIDKDVESKFKIRKIRADNLTIETGKTGKVELKDIEVNWNKSDRDIDEFFFDAGLSVNSSSETDLNGKLLLKGKKKSADLVIKIANIENLYKTDLINIPKDTNTKIRTNITYLADIESRTKFSFYNKQSREFGELKLNLLYRNGNLALNNSFFELNDLLKLQMRGEVEDLDNKRLLTISSELRVKDLNRLSEWTDFINKNELSGSFQSNRIVIKGSEKLESINLKAGGILKDANYQSANYSFQDVNSDLELEMNFPDNEAILKINFNTGESKITISGNNTIQAEKFYTSKPSEIKYSRDSESEFLLEGKGFDFSKAAYSDYLIENGTINSFKFRKGINRGFSLDADILGNNLHSDGFRVSYSAADINIQNKDDKTVTSGNLDFDKGEISSYNVEKYKGDFIFEDNKVLLQDSTIKADYLDNAYIKKSSITLPQDGKSDIKIELQDAALSGLVGKLESDIKKAKFIFDINSSSLTGNIDARSIAYEATNTSNLKLDLSFQKKRIEIKNLKSEFSGGNLEGEGWINVGNNTNTFRTSVEAKGIKIPTSTNYPLKKISTVIDGQIGESGINARGTVKLEELEIKKDINSSNVNGRVDLLLEDETIHIENGFINNESSKNINFKGIINNYRKENRRAEIDISETALGTVKEVFYPLLPFEIQEGELSGTIKTEFGIGQTTENFDWNGKIKINDASLDTLLSLTEFTIEGVNGAITLDKSVISKNTLSEVIGKNLEINREVYSNFLNRLEHIKEESGDANYLKIKNINYGFLNVKNIETNFEMNPSKINFNHIEFDIYDGRILGTGIYNISKNKYNVSLLFNDISLSSVSESIPSIKDYITGRVNGMMWINDGKNIGSIDGLFSLWVIESDREKMSIGRALLDKIGARGRFFTGSSRRYDKGVISGYIKEGFMTFKELEISNTILGYKDLKILVDEKKNSISVKQLLSVIKEIAKRAGSGDIKLDFEKKEK